jgi:membrane protein YdbS with pleckstrin-like domain
LPNESVFCNHCGAQVEEIEESPARAASPSIRTPRPARRRPTMTGPKPVSRPADDREEEDQYYPEYREEAETDEDEEDIIFRISPTFLGVTIAYFIAILLSIGVTAGAAFIGLPLGIPLAISAIFFIQPIRMHIENKRIVYTLTNIKIEIEEGYFSQTVRSIPLRNVQDVSVKESFKERIIGVGDVVIDSAAATAKITMDNINNPRKYADLILDQLEYWR